MTRNRNNKRNQRRVRNHKSEETAHQAASMLMGAIMHKAFETVFGKEKKETEDKPFNGIRKVSDTHIDCGVCGPTDGTAKEIPIPEGFEVFISEDGKPMIHKKVKITNEEGKPITYEDIAKKLFEDKYDDLNCCVSEAQVKRLAALNKLQNIAIYLNDGWHPKFKGLEDPFVIVKTVDDEFMIAQNKLSQSGAVYFKTKDLANEAIRIMGKESLADLFNTNL